ncbi:XRE family transcriptional regulator [Nocardiopsis gilva YIM 90087]|uniref:XRE family transcriptional regulator n=1 Tax=Nocardiopsis gilva YIM 90087 TaxID=1235441 RepID=A0A223S671_9ACTN|nr:helix-turn-helix domain-containing protein [Nocardiopsis gilva]ASU83602.1 XRE family transcriptional regulator [Nocardiopsis gilva YIM 90087]
MDEITSIGPRLRRLRTDHGMTQTELADRSSVSVELISKLERGARQTAKLSSLTKIARGLDEDLSVLVGKSNRVKRVGEAGVLAVRDAVSDPALLPGLDADDDGEPTDPADLWAQVERAYGAYFAGHFGALASTLPHLLSECRITRAALGPGPVAAAYAHAYQLAACLMIHTGKDDASLLASERGIHAAAEGEDEFRLATLYGTYTWILLRMGRHSQAEALAVRTAESIEPSWSTRNPRQLTAWGGQLLHAAVVAGAAERHDDAQQYLAQAKAGADLMGEDRHDYWVSFGPTSVAMQEAHVWTAADQPTRVLQASERVDPRALFPISYARHSLNEAAALERRRNVDEAIAVADRAFQISPEWFRHQRFAGSVVTDLTSRKTQLPAALRRMAQACTEGQGMQANE